MKKHLIVGLVALLLLPLTAGAQRMLKIYYGGQVIDEISVWDMDSLTFSPVNVAELPQGAAIPVAMDLGLSVKWADVNLGATKATDAGWYVGWGDVTGLNKSVNAKWYPVETPTGDITGTGNDIIRQLWSTESVQWRLPTNEELQELIDNCTWEWKEKEDSLGFLVYGEATDSIFLPAVGYRNGQDMLEVGTTLSYWSGSLNTADKSQAFALAFTKGGTAAKPTVEGLARYMGCALRAVNGEASINMSVTAAAVTNSKGIAGVNSATINLQFSGSYSSYGVFEYGVLYSTSNTLPEGTSQKLSTTTAATYLSANGTATLQLAGLQSDVTYYYLPYAVIKGKTVY